MQTVLILPDGVSATSGNNPTLIGNMNGGTSTKVTWTVVFEKDGTHTLQVQASGYDSNGNPCFASKSTIVTVGEVASPSPPLIPYEALMAIGILLVVVLGGAFVLLRRRRAQLKT